jgi:RNA polymerase sigma-70 factor (ECF subfamily)
MRERFSGLYEEHYGHVLRYALRRTDAEMARDVAAETFTVAWRRMEQLPVEPLPWLYGVARRVLANELRGQHRRDRLSSRLELAASAAGVPTVQPDHALEVITFAHIHAAMAKLSPRDQEVLELIAWEDLDIAGAATVLGCSNTACKVRLHRARRRLALMLHVAPELRNDPLSRTQLPEVVA